MCFDANRLAFRRLTCSTLFPYTTLFRSEARRIAEDLRQAVAASPVAAGKLAIPVTISIGVSQFDGKESMDRLIGRADEALYAARSEEHTSELQSRENLVCRLLLEKKEHS